MNEETTTAEITSPGLELVAAERRRQITEEGYTVETDLAHNSTEALIGASIAYLMASVKHPAAADWWPVGWAPMKSTTPERDRVKGLALGIAALDRIKAEEARKGVE